MVVVVDRGEHGILIRVKILIGDGYLFCGSLSGANSSFINKEILDWQVSELDSCRAFEPNRKLWFWRKQVWIFQDASPNRVRNLVG